MNILDVIHELSKRLGPPVRTGEFKGRPCATWGTCSYSRDGIDCYSTPDGATRVATWHSTGAYRVFVIDGADAPGTTPFRSSTYPTFSSVRDIEAYDGVLWPAIVPLDVAVELAAKTMGEATRRGERS